jgi:hypothetical protein
MTQGLLISSGVQQNVVGARNSDVDMTIVQSGKLRRRRRHSGRDQVKAAFLVQLKIPNCVEHRGVAELADGQAFHFGDLPSEPLPYLALCNREP